MTLRARRILSLIFILIFLIVAPTVVLYASGYKLSKNGFYFQKTGMFIVDSKPKSAKIFINGQAQKTLLNSLFNKNIFVATPAKIKNLSPGEYDLSLELEGYWSWQKKLTISPGASTFVEDIYLFKNDQPIQIAPAKIQSINLLSGKNRPVILSDEQIAFFNLSDETMQSVSRNSPGENIAWSDDGQKLVVDNYLYDLNDLNHKINLSQLMAGSFNYKWSDNTLFSRDETSIYRLNNENLPKKIINNLKFNDYLIKAGFLYLIKQAKPVASLKIIDLESKTQVKEINLPAPGDYTFINPGQALLNLYDNNHKILYLIDPLAYSPLMEIINNVKITFWINRSLLYAGDYEIWLYNLETGEKTLITRVSKKISQAIMHPNKNYIIYSTDQTINAIELDEREKRNTAELVKFDLISSFALNPKGNILYFSGRIDEAEGLYKLLVQ